MPGRDRAPRGAEEKGADGGRGRLAPRPRRGSRATRRTAPTRPPGVPPPARPRWPEAPATPLPRPWPQRRSPRRAPERWAAALRSAARSSSTAALEGSGPAQTLAGDRASPDGEDPRRGAWWRATRRGTEGESPGAALPVPPRPSPRPRRRPEGRGREEESAVPPLDAGSSSLDAAGRRRRGRDLGDGRGLKRRRG